LLLRPHSVSAVVQRGVCWAIRMGGLPMLWLVVAVLMVRDDARDPYQPDRHGTGAYGHNYEGALVHGLGLTLLELAVLYAILRPWSYRQSWARSALALLLFLPWTAFSMLMTMHAGGVIVLHFLWLAGVIVALVLLTSWSALVARRIRRTAASG